MNTKLINRPLYEDVAERLREQIFAHELAPGSWLDEQSLALALRTCTTRPPLQAQRLRIA